MANLSVSLSNLLKGLSYHYAMASKQNAANQSSASNVNVNTNTTSSTQSVSKPVEENKNTVDNLAYGHKIIDEKILYWLDYLSKENVDIKLFIVITIFLSSISFTIKCSGGTYCLPHVENKTGSLLLIR